jgi:protein ImuB
MLSPPERVENVVALLPDQPPRRFTWRGRAYRVRRADGPERIHGEWWKALAEAEAVRDYFQVEAEEGARFWLFRRGDGVDARTGDLSWYLHGVFG